MRALQFTGPDQFHLNEVPVPEPGPDEVLVASRSVGICHSDIELLAGRYIIPFAYPVIPGHEWSGEVVRVGRDVKGLGVGDRVVGECVIGDDHFGFSISGAAAEFFLAKEAWLHRLPDNLSWTQGAWSSRSAAATTRRSAPTTSTRATRFSCSGPDRSGSASWPPRWAEVRRSSWPSPQRTGGSSLCGSVPTRCSTPLPRASSARCKRPPTATGHPSSSRRAASRRRWRRRSRSLRSA